VGRVGQLKGLGGKRGACTARGLRNLSLVLGDKMKEKHNPPGGPEEEKTFRERTNLKTLRRCQGENHVKIDVLDLTSLRWFRVRRVEAGSSQTHGAQKGEAAQTNNHSLWREIEVSVWLTAHDLRGGHRAKGDGRKKGCWRPPNFKRENFKATFGENWGLFNDCPPPPQFGIHPKAGTDWKQSGTRGPEAARSGR